MQSTLNIQNLKCGGCANTIITRLNQLEGIDAVTVDNDTDSVSFSYQNESDIENASALLSKLGYPIEGDVNTLGKKAKSFVSCAVGRLNN
ncbi:cation transporter [Winogradskyella sp. 3972H.M.0a.05]|uniref:heavy-metal-associated domain-containing protein n=1 Tax=Winogradskyella sp. 3972H.M.0a.05 TaxID=2950277 RepID=UPI00339584A2